MAASYGVPGAGAVHACPRPLMVKEPFSTHYTDLTEHWPTPDQLPVVYHDRYNVHFFGLEKLHPFDACKFRKVVQALTAKGVIVGREQLVTPLAASREVLSDVHSAQYLEEIHTSTLRVVQVTELAPLTLLPNALLQWRVVTPMRIHVGGTMLAAGLALERGWAVNIGGGMHHAYHSAGGGWCPFDDVMLAVRRLRKATGGALKRVLYVDLDAHQGNGVARDKLHFNDADFIILDVYTDGIYPNDLDAKAGIDIAVPLKRGTGDVAYLSALRSALDQATREYPDIDLVFYNAGTDILDGDPLGRLGVSAAGVVERDEVVWRWAMDTLRAPVVMTLSGGYSTRSAQVIADSLENLFTKFNLAAGLPQ